MLIWNIKVYLIFDRKFILNEGVKSDTSFFYSKISQNIRGEPTSKLSGYVSNMMDINPLWQFGLKLGSVFLADFYV
jgi:hypothetical protein